MNRRIGTILLVLIMSVFGITALASAATVDGVDSAEMPASAPPIGGGLSQTISIDSAILWVVEKHQNDDGGYAPFSTGANVATSTVRGTVDAILSIAATGYHAAVPLGSETVSPIDFLRANPAEMQSTANASGGDAGKIVLALVAAHQNSADFGGIDYNAILANQFDGGTGAADSTAFRHSLAMLGMAASGQTAPANAVTHLTGLQAVDGSWDDGFGTTQNTDSTAMAIMALLSAGEAPASTAVSNAKTFLAGAQLPSGAFEYGAGFGASPNATALVIQALSALGEDFYSENGDWDAGAGATPLAALYRYQNAGSGAFQADFGSGPFDDYFTTLGAILGMSGKSYPLVGRYATITDAISCLVQEQDIATGGWMTEFDSISAGDTSHTIQGLVQVNQVLSTSIWTTASGATPLIGLESATPDFLMDGQGGSVGIVMQGAVRISADVSNFAGANLPVLLSGTLAPDGYYGITNPTTFAQSEAILGLIDNGLTPAITATQWLSDAQVAPGDWGSSRMTGIALQVFGKSGSDLIPLATAQLLARQQPDGGFYEDPLGLGGPDTTSTSEVIQGIWSNGYQPYGPAWSVVIDGKVTNAADFIMRLQAPSGCWAARFDNSSALATGHALLALGVEGLTPDFTPIRTNGKLWLPLVATAP